MSSSAVTVLFGRGPAGNSDTRIILFGFQPAPAIRMLLVFFLAAYFARRWEFFRSLALNRTGRFRILRPADLLPMAGGVALALGLFLLEKDTGPAVLLFACWAALYLAARKHLALIAVSVVLLTICVWAGFQFIPLKLSTAIARIELYRNTWNNRISAQTAEGIWAYAAGGTTGQGLGLGYPAMVPQATTDMVIPALAEETGAIGVACIAMLYGFLVWTGMRITRRAPSHYQFFLALGLTVSLAGEVILIAGGGSGVLPLSGVVSPFLSYGKSTQLIYFAVAGVLCAISARRTDSAQTVHFHVPMKAVSAAMLVLAAIITATALTYQTVMADALSVREVTIHSRKGGSEVFANPRLQALAALIPRGSIFDRNGLVLAASHWDEVNAQAVRFQAIGIDIRHVCDPSDLRHYPAGNLTVHLLGDIRQKLLTQQDRQLEHRWNNVLQGYERLEQMLPLLRHRFDTTHPAVHDLLQRDRSLHLTLDLPLQIRVARALAKGAAGKPGAAAVITDPSTGEVLSAFSMPVPNVPIPGVAFQRPEDNTLIDRARAGSYPPGSIFKLMVTEIGLMHDPSLIGRSFCPSSPAPPLSSLASLLLYFRLDDAQFVQSG